MIPLEECINDLSILFHFAFPLSGFSVKNEVQAVHDQVDDDEKQR